MSIEVRQEVVYEPSKSWNISTSGDLWRSKVEVKPQNLELNISDTVPNREKISIEVE